MFLKKAPLRLLLFTISVPMALSGCQGTTAHNAVKPVSSLQNDISSAVSSSTASSASSSEDSDSSSQNSAASSSPSFDSFSDKVAYLTFDDGPTEMTPKIVEVLKQHNVKATFFVVHKKSPQLAQYTKLAFEAGNEIAAHSDCHNYKKIYRSVNSFMEDFDHVDQWIESITGQKTKQLRFPGGSSISGNYLRKPVLKGILSALHDRGIVHHDWNVSSGDASTQVKSKAQILENVKKEAVKFKEPVILMHDVERNTGTLEALPEIIEWLKAKGYSFNTVSNIHQPAQHRTYAAQVPSTSSQKPSASNVSKPASVSSTHATASSTASEKTSSVQSDKHSSAFSASSAISQETSSAQSSD